MFSDSFESLIGSEVVVYCRVSSEDQQERETIENQIEYGTNYCKLNKLTIKDWYTDDGITGTIHLRDRPEGQRLIEDARSGKIKTVLIYNMKRLGRVARITLDAIYELEKHGVMIKSMTELFDTSTPTGRFIITVLAGQAELDRDTTLETMWHGANRAARKGKWLGGIVPYGYKKNLDGYLEINSDPLPGKEEMSESSVIELMYHLCSIRKMTTVKIADYFNSLAIPPSYIKDNRSAKRGKRKEKTAGIWRPSRIGNMLKNSTYRGLHVYGKRSTKDRELIEREVPAIVSDEIWNLAQKVIEENQIESLKNSKRQYLLRGIVKCGCCGLTYHGTSYTSEGRKPSAFYVCNGKTSYRGPLQGKCRSRNIPAAWIEEMVWQQCVDFINNPGETIQELAETDNNTFPSIDNYTDEKELVIKSLMTKDNEKQNILELYRKNLITSSDVEIQLLKIAGEKKELENRAKDLTDLIERNALKEKQTNDIDSILSDLRKILKNDLTYEAKRAIVKLLVKKIVVHTHFDDGKKRNHSASVNTEFSFNVKVSDGTLVLVDMQVPPLTNADAHKGGSSNTKANCQARYSTA
ncbi:recombinase family protein [Paenibacillus alvei]|uniref:Recombinase family protein n=1 Tax=Paenibacillus alvei TaxID=44250 RepID=A0ABT4H184_PAEAL|nr:recombinase family protein [Paenibacillus alvei]MCY9762708.1 recombinase family protein [Paenibacillus alvei]